MKNNYRVINNIKKEYFIRKSIRSLIIIFFILFNIINVEASLTVTDPVYSGPKQIYGYYTVETATLVNGQNGIFDTDYSYASFWGRNYFKITNYDYSDWEYPGSSSQIYISFEAKKDTGFLVSAGDLKPVIRICKEITAFPSDCMITTDSSIDDITNSDNSGIWKEYLVYIRDAQSGSYSKLQDIVAAQDYSYSSGNPMIDIEFTDTGLTGGWAVRNLELIDNHISGNLKTSQNAVNPPQDLKTDMSNLESVNLKFDVIGDNPNQYYPGNIGHLWLHIKKSGQYIQNSPIMTWQFTGSRKISLDITNIIKQHGTSLEFVFTAQFPNSRYQISNVELDWKLLTSTISLSTTPSGLNPQPSSGGTFVNGQTATVTAPYVSGYTFQKWTENGNQVSTSSSYSFTVTKNRNLVAVYSQNTYSISASTSPSGLSPQPTGGGTYPSGQTAIVTAQPVTGYTFQKWTENGNQVSTSSSYSFTVTKNRNLAAVYSQNTYSISVSTSPSGLSPQPTGGGTYPSGQTTIVTAQPVTGYTFQKWTENGNQVSTSSSYSFTVSQNRNLVAVYSQNTYSISVSTSPSGLVPQPTGGGTSPSGQTAIVTAQPVTGYTFQKWTENGNQVSTSPSYSFTVTSSRYLVAIYNPILITITVTPSTVSLFVGATQTFTATDQNGYPITVTWNIGDTNLGSVNPGTGTSTTFTAKSTGTTTIAATNGSVSGSADVTVKSLPNQPTSLTQYRSDGLIIIPTGGTTPEKTVTIKGTVSDPDGDTVQLEVEVRPAGTPFSGTPTCISDPAVTPGGTANATCSGLSDGQYHWQARAKDSSGDYSSWVAAGGDPDFIVDTTKIDSCTTISSPGTYVLTRDIINSSAPSCINITSNDVVLEGASHTIDGVYAWPSYGVHVYNSTVALKNITVKNLNVTDWPYGIVFNNTSKGNITNNYLNSNNYGIHLKFSSNNTLNKNKADFNSFGLIIQYSSNNFISNNIANFNDKGIGIYNSGSNILTNNTANSNADNGIDLDYSSNNTLTKNIATSNGYMGIFLDSSSNNTLSGNNMSNNRNGIYIDSSSNNTLSGNNASSNNNHGINLYFSNNNIIYNNYLNNTINSLDNGNNIWNITKTNGMNIVGGPYLGGNYWAYPNGTGFSETCSDSDEDGICDSSYALSSVNIDHLPLTTEWNGNFTPIDGCSVISSPGTYVLIRDIIDNSANVCINITSSDVIFDGAGHKVQRLLEWESERYGVYAFNPKIILENITVKNLTVTGWNYGIYFYSFRNSMLSGNTASNNLVDGIFLNDFNNITLKGNTAYGNDEVGIFLNDSRNTTLSGNTASENLYSGIILLFTINSTMSNNTASDNDGSGIDIGSSSNITLSRNTFLNNEGAGIDIVSSSNITLSENTAWGYFVGINLLYSSNIILSRNNISNNNWEGINMYLSINSTLIGNNISNNGIGIDIGSSSNNLIYNNYFNNTNNAYDDGNNIWNITKTPGTNIIGGPYLGGNYWSDYSGSDTDGDGLGDTLFPYNSSGNITYGGDYLPLVYTTGDTIPPAITIISPENRDYETNTIPLNYFADEPIVNCIAAVDSTANQSLPACENLSFISREYETTSDTAAWWHFNENSGNTVLDSSGYTNTGTINGASWIEGKFGSALQFDGLTTYVEIPDSDTLDGGSQITIEAWVKPVLGARGSVAAKYTYDRNIPVNDRVYELDIMDDGSINFALSSNGRSSGTVWLTSVNKVSSNVWNHIVAVSDGSIMKIYINGVMDPNTVPSPSVIHSSPYDLQIGAWKNNISSEMITYFKGEIDEIRILKKALKENEIKSDYLLGEGSHKVTIYAEDLSGNSNSVTRSFSINQGNTPPASITNLQNITYEQTYINWTWTDPEDMDFDHVEVYIGGSFKKNVSKGVQFYNGTGFTPDTGYTIATRTSDTSGDVNLTWVTNTSRTAPFDLPLMADSIGFNDSSGVEGSSVQVPLKIVNVRNGPIQTIVLSIDYNESVISLESVDTGSLTQGWFAVVGGDNHSITMSTFNKTKAIPDGSTGIVGYFNFKVVGSPGDTTLMNPEEIDFSNTANEHGTTLPNSGNFEILKLGSISGMVSYSNNGTSISGAIVNLKKGVNTVNTTITDTTGKYAFTDLLPGSYELEISKNHFYDENSSAEVYAGINTVVDITLGMKGDLDNNGKQADAVDVNMMIQASVKDIPADRYFDLDGNSRYADAVDVNMMIQASVKDIILNGAKSTGIRLSGTASMGQMADSFGVSDTNAKAGSMLSVPLEVVNIANGPIQTLIVSMDYDESVISLESVDIGPLAQGLFAVLGRDKHSITMSTFDKTKAIPDGSTGVVGYLNFKVIGNPGDTTAITPEDIDFSNTANEHGTAPSKSGIFSVSFEKIDVSIHLNAGWNLISVPLNLTTWQLSEEAVVGNPLNVTPTNCLSSIYRYNTTTALFEKSDHFDNWGWWPATGSESFTELEPGRGYWVMANQDCSLTFTGTMPSDLDVSLDSGWNLIGWYSDREALLGEEAAVGNPLNVTPVNSLTSIYRYNPTSALFEKSDHFDNWGWWPATGSESFTGLEPGRGYWVMARDACEWWHETG